MTITHTAAPAAPQTNDTTLGRRVELAVYKTDAGDQRRLIGQRIDGNVHVFDEPVAGEPTTYLVEDGLTTNSELTALVEDYTAKAETLGYPPMHGWF